jgi:hypothetical protein
VFDYTGALQVSVVFHIIVGAAIAHAAASTLRRLPDGEPVRPTLRLVTLVGLLAVLSHGVLDGLKHGYPLTPLLDAIVAVPLAIVWCAAVRPSLWLLFSCAMLMSVAPDLIDHTPVIVRSELHIAVPLNPLGPMFPGHWRDGSGSMDPGQPHRCHDLNAGRNRAVSLTNHMIVVGLSLGCIAMAPWAFRRPRARA